MTQRPRIVVADLDSTVALTSQRHHLSPHADPANTWRDYGLACAGDTPAPGVVRALQLHRAAGLGVYLLSGRHADTRGLTLAWLAQHRVPFDHLRLATDADSMDNVLYKRDVVAGWQSSGLEVVLAYEDWPAVAGALEEIGVPTVIVNPCYDDNPMKFWAQQTVPGQVVATTQRA